MKFYSKLRNRVCTIQRRWSAERFCFRNRWWLWCTFQNPIRTKIRMIFNWESTWAGRHDDFRLWRSVVRRTPWSQHQMYGICWYSLSNPVRWYADWPQWPNTRIVAYVSPCHLVFVSILQWSQIDFIQTSSGVCLIREISITWAVAWYDLGYTWDPNCCRIWDSENSLVNFDYSQSLSQETPTIT